MESRILAETKAKIGDKVKIKTGEYRGFRGVVELVNDRKGLFVQLEDSGQTIWLETPEVTNFSLAARKAWKTLPDRNVGRRKGVRLRDRVSVTLRFDRDLWERFTANESNGRIQDRTGTFNTWLREKLDALDQEAND